MKLIKENCKYQESWDYLGYEKFVKKENIQFDLIDWEVTLITKINNIKTQIYMSNNVESVSNIEVNSKFKPLIKVFRNVYGDKFDSLYDVFFNDKIEEDCFFIYQKPNLNQNENEMILGSVEILNYNK
jgi:hypothetical protein